MRACISLHVIQLEKTSAREFETVTALKAVLATLETIHGIDVARIAKLTEERNALRASHERLRLELELLSRRTFVAKAERVDTAQLELELAATLAALDRLGGIVPAAEATSAQAGEGRGGKNGGKKKPTGRRNLREAALEEERVELVDPLFEALVAEGYPSVSAARTPCSGGRDGRGIVARCHWA